MRDVAELRGDVDGRHIFIVEVEPAPDALARLLVPFAVVQARLEAVDYRCVGATATVRLEVSDLLTDRAELLRRRLAGLVMVRGVGLGWRCGHSR